MKDILYGIKIVEIEELDPKTQLPKEDGAKFLLNTAESAEMESVKSEGTEETARSDEKILAVVRTPDLLYGYDVKFKDNTFDPQIASLIEGGVVRVKGNQVVGYRSPMLAEGASKMKPFRMNLYIANYEGDSIKNYVKLILNNCTGKAPAFSVGKEFFAPEFEIKAREATKANLPIKDMIYVDDLPALPQPEIISVNASVGTLDEDSITSIPNSTTVAQLLNGVYASFGASKKVVDTNGDDKETGKLITTDKLVVYLLDDPENKKEYTLTILGE